MDPEGILQQGQSHGIVFPASYTSPAFLQCHSPFPVLGGHYPRGSQGSAATGTGLRWAGLSWRSLLNSGRYLKCPAMLPWHLELKQLPWGLTARATTLRHCQWEHSSFSGFFSPLTSLRDILVHADTSGAYSQPARIHTTENSLTASRVEEL